MPIEDIDSIKYNELDSATEERIKDSIIAIGNPTNGRLYKADFVSAVKIANGEEGVIDKDSIKKSPSFAFTSSTSIKELDKRFTGTIGGSVGIETLPSGSGYSLVKVAKASTDTSITISGLKKADGTPILVGEDALLYAFGSSVTPLGTLLATDGYSTISFGTTSTTDHIWISVKDPVMADDYDYSELLITGTTSSDTYVEMKPTITEIDGVEVGGSSYTPSVTLNYVMSLGNKTDKDLIFEKDSGRSILSIGSSTINPGSALNRSVVKILPVQFRQAVSTVGTLYIEIPYIGGRYISNISSNYILTIEGTIINSISGSNNEAKRTDFSISVYHLSHISGNAYTPVVLSNSFNNQFFDTLRIAYSSTTPYLPPRLILGSGNNLMYGVSLVINKVTGKYSDNSSNIDDRLIEGDFKIGIATDSELTSEGYTISGAYSRNNYIYDLDESYLIKNNIMKSIDYSRVTTSNNLLGIYKGSATNNTQLVISHASLSSSSSEVAFISMDITLSILQSGTPRIIKYCLQFYNLNNGVNSTWAIRSLVWGDYSSVTNSDVVRAGYNGGKVTIVIGNNTTFGSYNGVNIDNIRIYGKDYRRVNDNRVARENWEMEYIADISSYTNLVTLPVTRVANLGADMNYIQSTPTITSTMKPTTNLDKAVLVSSTTDSPFGSNLGYGIYLPNTNTSGKRGGVIGMFDSDLYTAHIQSGGTWSGWTRISSIVDVNSQKEKLELEVEADVNISPHSQELIGSVIYTKVATHNRNPISCTQLEDLPVMIKAIQDNINGVVNVYAMNISNNLIVIEEGTLINMLVWRYGQSELS